MPYLIIAIVFGSLFAILFKIFQKSGVNALQAIGVNYITALILGSMGNIVVGAPVVSAGLWIVPALLAGLFMMGGFVVMNSATRVYGVAVATIAARISFVVPVLCAYWFLGGNEPEWTASLLVVLSLLLIFYKRDAVVGNINDWFLPLLVFLCYGLANFFLKMGQQMVADAGGGDADLRMITTIAFAAALLYTIIYYYWIQPAERREPYEWRNMWAGVLLGVTNMGCTYFLLKSLMVIDAALFYPIYNIAIVSIAVLVGRMCFGERLSWSQYGGIAVAVVAIVLFFC